MRTLIVLLLLLSLSACSSNYITPEDIADVVSSIPITKKLESVGVNENNVFFTVIDGYCKEYKVTTVNDNYALAILLNGVEGYVTFKAKDCVTSSLSIEVSK